jgi:hypothetical protein
MRNMTPARNRGWWQRGNKKYLYSEAPSTFVRRAKCSACDSGVTVLVAPSHWPVEAVARVCYACGRVREYVVSGLLLFTPRQAIRERRPRQHVVKHRTALERETPHDFETVRNMIIMGIETGLEEAVIAEELRLTPLDVRRIAAASGY